MGRAKRRPRYSKRAAGWTPAAGLATARCAAGTATRPPARTSAGPATASSATTTAATTGSLARESAGFAAGPRAARFRTAAEGWLSTAEGWFAAARPAFLTAEAGFPARRALSRIPVEGPVPPRAGLALRTRIRPSIAPTRLGAARRRTTRPFALRIRPAR